MGGWLIELRSRAAYMLYEGGGEHRWDWFCIHRSVLYLRRVAQMGLSRIHRSVLYLRLGYRQGFHSGVIGF